MEHSFTGWPVASRAFVVLAGWAVSGGVAAGCVAEIGSPAVTDPGSGMGGASGNGGSGAGGRGAAQGGGGAAGEVGKLMDGGPGPWHLRRLTREEYNNTIFDLLGDNSKPASAFSSDVLNEFGFENDAQLQVVTGALAEDYNDAAGDLAARAVSSNLAKLVGCDVAVKGEVACARGFVTSFGLRAYRRPLSDAEVTSLMGSYTAGCMLEGFKGGIEIVLARMLQSPAFIYKFEIGDPGDKGKSGTVRLGSWEMASRLSYFLWATMPDDALFAAAQDGMLATPAQIETQVRRMLESPKAHQAVARFHEQWLRLGKIDALAKDAKIFPDFKDSLRDLLKQESLHLAESVVFETGDIRTLFTAGYSFMNKDLAMFLQIPEARQMAGTGFQRITLDPSGPPGARQRKGILTHAGLLAAIAKANETSPVLRGKFILEQVLCQHVPPPPQGVNATPPPPDPNFTTRERFEKVAEAPGTICANCHHVMDPPGFALENFDATGRFRSMENKKPVDATALLAGTVDIDGQINGAIELVDKVAGSGELGKCVAKQWFRYAVGRADVPGDEKNIASLGADLAAGKYDLRELLVAVAKSQAFTSKVKESTP